MLRIGDFSKLTHVSVRMLRYYDNQGLLKPSYIDPQSGYRMYTTEQVPQLQKIVLLRDLNFGVSEIQELLQNWNDEYLVRRLHDKVREIEGLILDQRVCIQKILSAVDHVKINQFDKYYNVTIKSIPPCPVVALRTKVDSYFDEGKLWPELADFVQREHIELEKTSHNNIALYHDEEHKESDMDIEICFVVKHLGSDKDGFVFRTIPAVEHMACMLVYGPYENLAGAYCSFMEWLDKNQPYTMGNPSRQTTIVDRRHTDNPEEYLTEIQIPLLMKMN